MQRTIYKRYAPALVCMGLALTAGSLRAANVPSLDAPLRIGISDQVVYGVNRNDAAAAIGIWLAEIAKASDTRLERHQSLLLSTDQIISAARDNSLDLFCLTLPEYRRVQAYIDIRRILSDGGDELQLLVRKETIRDLAGLQGRSLVILDSPVTLLAEVWLTVTLARAGLGTPASVFAHITRNPRMNQVVLPVFFGQADACITSRRAIETMFELNPQLEKQLKVLSSSPKLINAFLACRKDFPTTLKEPLFAKLKQVRSTAASKQVMMLFQSVTYSVMDGDTLRTSLELFDDYERRTRAPGKR